MVLKKLINFIVRSSITRFFYQLIYLYQLKFGLTISESENLISVLIPALAYAFFGKTGLNTIIIHYSKENYTQAKILSNILFLILYIPFSLILFSSFNIISFILSIIIYSLLIKADEKLFFENKNDYIKINNLLYFFLIIFVMIFPISKINFMNLDLIMILILIVSLVIYFITKTKFRFKVDKEIIIVQSGGLVSTGVTSIHSTALSGLELNQFTLGKSIGELPMNFFGYHISNYIHKEGISINKNLLRIICFVAFIYLMITFFMLFNHESFNFLFSNYILTTIIFLLSLPIILINTIFTRALHKSKLIKEGTFIQIFTNTFALLLIYYSTTSLSIFCGYIFTFSMGSLISYFLIKKHAEKN